VNSLAQSVTLLLLGGVVLRISLADVYLRYVKEGLRPYLIAAGVLLLAVAVATMIRDLRSEAAEEHDDGHGHGHRGPAIAWLLTLPVFAIFLVAPPALGSYAAARSGSAAVQEQAEFAPLPHADPVAMTNVDYATRAIWDKGTSMRGRTIRLTGFLTPRPAGGFYLTRILLSCCAADGRPIKVGLDGELPPGLKADDWIQAEGHYTARQDRNKATRETIVFLTVTGAHPVRAPAEPYE
jgi:uncharacterized repeat protein (TIGR03943 family)